MKKVNLTKKLVFNKSTVASLDMAEQAVVKGGDYYTAINQSCKTWDPLCPTRPLPECGPF